MNVVQSGSYFAQTIQPGANWKTVAKFENASGLRCAWMNKIASLIIMKCAKFPHAAKH